MICQYVPKGGLSVQIQIGLLLRVFELDADRLHSVRTRIYNKFGTIGIHVAELTQRGITTELLTRLIKMYPSPADVQSRFVMFLEHSDELAIFVKTEDRRLLAALEAKIKVRVEASDSHMAILFARGSAIELLQRIVKKLRTDAYVCEIQEEGKQLTVFVFTSEMRSKLRHWTEALSLDEERID